MQRDDFQVISTFVAQGASYWSVQANELAPWKERLEGMRHKFADAYPEVIRQYRAITHFGDR